MWAFAVTLSAGIAVAAVSRLRRIGGLMRLPRFSTVVL